MILITGGAGFIGSALVWQLNCENKKDILICDRFRSGDKWKNLQHLKFHEVVNPENLFSFIEENKIDLTHIIHLGACSNTGEVDMDFLYENNVRFSQKLWQLSIEQKAKFIYASSAATYGDGKNGFDDDQDKIAKLRPLNKYGYSKQLFDEWVLKQKNQPALWIGLKFFNVFGPNEYHKGSMSSVLFHSVGQIKKYGFAKLFKSERKEYQDGEQLRDFVYIKDVTKVISFLMEKKPISGIYNLGSGQANSFKDFVTYAFEVLNKKVKIEYIPIPVHIRDKYQYYTLAKMNKLFGFTPNVSGDFYNQNFYSLKDAVRDYVGEYLIKEDPHLKII